jgi:hypothetical protein
VFTSQKTHFVSITKTSHLMLFRRVAPANKCGQNAEGLIMKGAVDLFTPVPQRIEPPLKTISAVSTAEKQWRRAIKVNMGAGMKMR